MAGAFGNSGFGGGGFGSRLRSWVQGLPNQGNYNSWLPGGGRGGNPPPGGSPGPGGMYAGGPGGTIRNNSTFPGGYDPSSGFVQGSVGNVQGPSSPPIYAGPGSGVPGRDGTYAPTGGPEPYNAGSSTTGARDHSYTPPGGVPYSSQSGVGTTMQPNGPAPTNASANTTAGRPSATNPDPNLGTGVLDTNGNWIGDGIGNVAVGSQTINPTMPLLPTDPKWFSSPQGLSQQMDLARRVMGPYAGLAPNRQPHAPVVPGSGPTQGYTSPMDAYRGMRGAERSAAFEAANAGQPRTWYAKELANAGVNWQGMNDMQQMRAYLNTLPPQEAADYLAKYAALGPNAGGLTMGGWQPGMDPMMPVPTTGSGIFGS